MSEAALLVSAERLEAGVDDLLRSLEESLAGSTGCRGSRSAASVCSRSRAHCWRGAGQAYNVNGGLLFH